jgi:large subunit ribosomal protein L2
VHNVELKIGKGGQVARSAGTFAQIVGRDQGYVIIRLNSGEQRLVHGQCFATIGAVSNPDHMNVSIGKAGRNRWLGWRRTTAASHEPDRPSARRRRRPHLGRPSSGHPWGKPTKGKKTRSNKRTDKFIVSSRTPARSNGREEDSTDATFSLERSVRRRIPSEEGRTASVRAGTT